MDTVYSYLGLSMNQFMLKFETESRYKKNLQLNPVFIYTKFWTVSTMSLFSRIGSKNSYSQSLFSNVVTCSLRFANSLFLSSCGNFSIILKT